MSKKSGKNQLHKGSTGNFSVFIQDHANQTRRSAPSGSFKSKINIGLLYRSTSI